MDETEAKCWKRLADTIIAQAGVDYLKAKRGLLKLTGCNLTKEQREKKESLESTVKECADFIRKCGGQWFLEKLDKGFEELRRTNRLKEIRSLGKALGI